MEFTKIIDIDRARTIAMEMARGNSAVPDCTGENNAVRIMLHKSWPKYFNANGTLTTQHVCACPPPLPPTYPTH